MKNSNKILIVGSSGQIGTALVFESRSRGIQTIGIDLRDNPWEASLTDLKIDFFDYFPDEKDRFTDLIFLATEPSAKRLEKNPLINTENYRNFDHAVELTKKYKMRLLIISSRELFGLSPYEVSIYPAQKLYEQQKKDFENSLFEMKKQGYKTGVLRVPIVFAGYDTDMERLPRLVPSWCAKIIEGEDVLIDNDGEVELVPVEKVANILINLLVRERGSFLKEIRGVHIGLRALADLIRSVVEDNQNKKNEASGVLRLGIKKTISAFS